jgi:hypothetical protein
MKKLTPAQRFNVLVAVAKAAPRIPIEQLACRCCWRSIADVKAVGATLYYSYDGNTDERISVHVAGEYVGTLDAYTDHYGTIAFPSTTITHLSVEE